MDGFRWLVNVVILKTHTASLIIFAAAVAVIVLAAAYLVKRETDGKNDTE